MNLPKVIVDLIKAQDNFDSVAYGNCFTETAVVFDEGHTFNGRIEIQQWIAKANHEYKSVMKPIGFTETEKTSVLSAEISGTFSGSPIVLKYHFEITNGQIQSLRITG